MLCTYQVKVLIGSTLPILMGSYLEIDIPSEVGITSQTNTISGSYTVGLEDSKRVITFPQSRTVRVTKVFDSTTKVEYALDSFSVYISNLMTPRST